MATPCNVLTHRGQIVDPANLDKGLDPPCLRRDPHEGPAPKTTSSASRTTRTAQASLPSSHIPLQERALYPVVRFCALGVSWGVATLITALVLVLPADAQVVPDVTNQPPIIFTIGSKRSSGAPVSFFNGNLSGVGETIVVPLYINNTLSTQTVYGIQATITIDSNIVTAQVDLAG